MVLAVVGSTERWLYRAVVCVGLPVAFCSYVNGKMESYYPFLPKHQLPPHVISTAPPPPAAKQPQLPTLTQGFYVDLPKAWFKARHGHRAEEFARTMFQQVWPLRLEQLWLQCCTAVGLPRYVQEEDGVSSSSKYAWRRRRSQDEKEDALDLTFETVPRGWFSLPKALVAGTHSLVVEDTGKQSVRLWFVSQYAVALSSSNVTKIELQPVAERHPVLGVVPSLVDTNTGQELVSRVLTAQVYVQRAFWRFVVDCTLTRMMRQRPLIQFFGDQQE